MAMSEVARNLKAKAGTIAPLLKRLVDKGCLIRVRRGEYTVLHKLFKHYLSMKMQGEYYK